MIKWIDIPKNKVKDHPLYGIKGFAKFFQTLLVVFPAIGFTVSVGQLSAKVSVQGISPTYIHFIPVLPYLIVFLWSGINAILLTKYNPKFIKSYILFAMAWPVIHFTCQAIWPGVIKFNGINEVYVWPFWAILLAPYFIFSKRINVTLRNRINKSDSFIQYVSGDSQVIEKLDVKDRLTLKFNNILKQASSPTKRIGLMVVMLSSIYLIFTAIHWNLSHGYIFWMADRHEYLVKITRPPDKTGMELRRFGNFLFDEDGERVTFSQDYSGWAYYDKKCLSRIPFFANTDPCRKEVVLDNQTTRTFTKFTFESYFDALFIQDYSNSYKLGRPALIAFIIGFMMYLGWIDKFSTWIRTGSTKTRS
ncbi:MAG: hypothetical protein AB7U43_11000 [Desulfobacter sp.]